MLGGNKNSLMWVTLIFSVMWFFRGMHQTQEFPSDLKVYSWQDFRSDVGKVYYDMGNLSLRRGDFRDAMKSFTTALKYDSALVPAYKKLQLICYRLGLKEEAARLNSRLQSIQVQALNEDFELDYKS